MILLNIMEVFQVIFIFIAGGLLFYLPALLLSFITGRGVKMGSRLFGPTVKSSATLDQVMQSGVSTVPANQTRQENPLKLTYVDWDKVIRPVRGEITVVEGRTVELSSNMSGGKWVCDNKEVAVVDPDTGLVLGLTYGDAVISYAVAGLIAQARIRVRPQRKLPTFKGES